MSVSFVSSGAISSGTNSASPGMPASRVSGNKMILTVVNKPASVVPDTPDGWTAVTSGTYTGGQGAAGADAGDVRISTFERITDAAESSPMTVTVTGGNSCQATIAQFSKTGGSWNVFATGGSDDTTGTSISIACASNLFFQTDDYAFCAWGMNSDLSTDTTSQTISASGATFSTLAEFRDTSSTLGNDLHTTTFGFPVTAGPSTGAPTISGTGTSSGASSLTGPGIVIRLSEVSTFGGVQRIRPATIISAQAATMAGTGSKTP